MDDGQSTLTLSMQTLSREMQTLSQSFKQATSSLQQASAGIVNQTERATRGLQSYAAAAMAPLSQPKQPYQPGFSGIPTAIQYSSGRAAPINGGKDNWWDNLLTSAGNNEYNKPSNWWRDVLALAGKDFIDVSNAEARKRARRNWELRGQDLLHSGIATGLAFIPGAGIPLALGYEFLAKPLLMENAKRTNEYINWYENTGQRNIGARWSRAYEGGWTESEQRELAERTQKAYKGSGFKKSQFDEMISVAEQYGYFRTYERTTVDQQVTKIKKMMSDAKYVMQSLHTTAEEAMKILGDVERMGNQGGKINTYAYVSQINRASAYSGLSPMQLHEYSVGRSEFFKGLGYSSRGATEMTTQQITQYYAHLSPGKRDNLTAQLSTSDKLSALVNNNDMIKYASIYAYDYGENGLVFNPEKYRKMARGEVTPTMMMEEVTNTINLAEAKDRQLLSLMLSPGIMPMKLSRDAERAKIPPSTIEKTKQRQVLQGLILKYNVAENPAYFTWKDYAKLKPDKQELIALRFAQEMGIAPEDADEYIKQIIGRGVNVDQEERETAILARGLPPQNLNLKFKREDFLSIQEKMMQQPGVTPPEGWDPFIRSQSRRQKKISQSEEDYRKTMAAADAIISNEEEEKIAALVRKAARKRDPNKYITKRIEKYQINKQYGAAYKLAERAEQGGLGDIDSYFTRAELTPSDVNQATRQLLGGFDLNKINKVYRPAFLNAVGEYAKAIASGDTSMRQEKEAEFREVSQLYFKNNDNIDYLIESIQKGIVGQQDHAKILGRGSEIYDLSTYLRTLGLEDKQERHAGKKINTIDLSETSNKQQTDINQTILLYMDKQVKAMDDILRRLEK